MICILQQEDALLSREGHLGSCSRQGEDGLRGHFGLGGALAMGWRMLALGTQAQWTVDGLSDGCDVWTSEHPVARHECFPRLVMCPLFFKRDSKSE